MNRDILRSHAQTLPYNMANSKPYECTSRHFSWRAIVDDMQDAPFADIAARIKWHRALVQMRQADYAQRAKITRSQLSNWESGQQRISIDGALLLRDVYGLSLDFIYAGIDETLPMTLSQAWRDRPEVSASK